MSDTNSAPNVPRKAWIAKALTHWSPGLGHLYCGKPLAALTIYFVGSSLMLTILTAMMFASGSLASWALLLLLVVGLGVSMYAAHDVKRVVGLVESDYQIQSYNRWWIYALIAIQPIGWAIPIAFLVKQHLLESYVIATDSMSPTLFLNDRILVDKRAAGEMSFDRWDVVVFRNPEERKQHHVKRIIGLPGETIKVDEQGKMTIDGKSLEKLDSTSKEATTPLLDQEPSEWTVPPNEVFVLGDNRTESHDSRHFGTVHIGDVLGPVTFIIKPSENWSRFGRFEP